MPTPDKVIFAPGVNFGEVRAGNEKKRLEHFRARIDHHICVQIRALGFRDTDDGEKWHHASPFPLAIMTCIALETLGSIFLATEAGTSDGHTVFKHACNEIDEKLYKPATKGFFGKLKKQFSEFDFKNCYSVSDLIYKKFRNRMAHDYMPGGVYLSGEDTETWDYDDSCIVLNPFWFAKQTFELVPKLFDSMAESDERKESCEKYLNLLLRTEDNKSSQINALPAES